MQFLDRALVCHALVADAQLSPRRRDGRDDWRVLCIERLGLVDLGGGICDGCPEGRDWWGRRRDWAGRAGRRPVGDAGGRNGVTDIARGRGDRRGGHGEALAEREERTEGTRRGRLWMFGGREVVVHFNLEEGGIMEFNERGSRTSLAKVALSRRESTPSLCQHPRGFNLLAFSFPRDETSTVPVLTPSRAHPGTPRFNCRPALAIAHTPALIIISALLVITSRPGHRAAVSTTQQQIFLLLLKAY